MNAAAAVTWSDRCSVRTLRWSCGCRDRNWSGPDAGPLGAALAAVHDCGLARADVPFLPDAGDRVLDELGTGPAHGRWRRARDRCPQGPAGQLAATARQRARRAARRLLAR